MTLKEHQLTPVAIEDLKRRLESGKIDDGDIEKLKASLDLVAFLQEALKKDQTRLKQLLRRIFGMSTEKPDQKTRQRSSSSSGSGRRGRLGRDDYKGASKTKVPHPELKAGDKCPECREGKLTEGQPGVDYHWQGHSPITLDIFLLQRLICNICKVCFTAPSPVADTAKTVDDSDKSQTPVGRCDKNAMANAVVSMFRYWYGVATYRLAKIQGSLGIGLPEASQYKMIRQVYEAGYPVYEHLIYMAAQGSSFCADDTWVRILDWLAGKGPPTQQGSPRKRATTSAIISKTEDGQSIVLYLTGTNPAGKNMSRILDHRHEDLEIPKYMCDGLAANKIKGHEVILLQCLDHARRRFYDLASVCPNECNYVLEELAKVYQVERQAKIHELDPHERLAFHREHSRPVMEHLGKWMYQKLQSGDVEANSDLGRDIKYVMDRWTELNEFHHIIDAPLSNAECERAIKRIITQRKNSLAYKTLQGAHTGDVIQSLIATCEQASVNPFGYIEWLQVNKSRVKQAPQFFTPFQFSALSA